jgi:hypothetical protein
MAFLSGRTSLTTVQTGDIADNAVTLAKFAHGTASQNIAYDGSGVPVDVALSTGASAAEKTNIMVNAFNIAAAGGFAYLNMVDGVVDEFEDATGVDASTSTNEVYDAANDHYSPLDVYSTDKIPDMTSNSAPSGTASASTNSSTAWRVFTDDGVTTAWESSSLTDWLEYDFGSGNGIIATRYKLTGNGVSYEPKDWTFEGYNGSTWDTLDTQTGASAWSIPETRTFTFSNSTSYERYRWNVTNNINGAGNIMIHEAEIITGAAAATNMTLFSNATTALAVPDDANIVIWQQDVTAITLNTDLKAYASRNNGSTYTQMTLAEVASPTTGRILTGTVDISGQSSGTAMKYKIETLNTKIQKIHAVALQWS